MSPANIHSAIRHTLIDLFGVRLADLDDGEKAILGWAADTADRMGRDVRSAIEECWRGLETTRLDRAERLVGPHGVGP